MPVLNILLNYSLISVISALGAKKFKQYLVLVFVHCDIFCCVCALCIYHLTQSKASLF